MKRRSSITDPRGPRNVDFYSKEKLSAALRTAEILGSRPPFLVISDALISVTCFKSVKPGRAWVQEAPPPVSHHKRPYSCDRARGFDLPSPNNEEISV